MKIIRQINPKTIFWSFTGCFLLILCLGAIIPGFLVFSGQFRLQSRWDIRLNVDQPGSSQTIEQKDIDEIISSLEDRASALGLPGASFKIINGNEIAGVIPGPKQNQGLIDTLISPGLYELIAVGDQPLDEGEIVTTDYIHPAFPPPAKGDQVFKTILTRKDLESVMVIKDSSGGYGVAITLTENGVKPFSEFTSKNVGKYVATLLDKRVINSPRITSPVRGRESVLNGNFSLKQANELSITLRSKPHPYRLRLESEDFFPSSIPFLDN